MTFKIKPSSISLKQVNSILHSTYIVIEAFIALSTLINYHTKLINDC